MYKRIKFKDGLRLLLAPSRNTEAVTILLLVGAGSRYESRATNGLAHFLEHMFFKGAKRYPTAPQVSEAIDSVGGEFNAFTGKEYVGYYIKVAKQHVKLAIDVLSDMMLHSKLDPAEIERERGVILEEINMYEDNPMAKVEEEFESLVFGDQPLGWKVAGPKTTIKQLKREDFISYQQTFYAPNNIVISIAGNFSVPTIKSLVHKYFTFPGRKKTVTWKPFQKLASRRVRLIHQKTEQAHLYLGVQGLSSRDPRRYVGSVLASLLGGGMSSRMFVSVRERQGLCYYIATGFDYYADAGVLETRAGVDLTRVDQAISAILKEYALVQRELVQPRELKKAKEYIKGQATLRMEASEELAEFLGRQELLFGDIHTLKDIYKKIDAVTAQDIRTLAKDLLRADRLRFALIGPYKNEKHFESLLKL